MTTTLNRNRYVKEQVAATVVVYNSEGEIINNVETYINQVDKLYVVDNSEITNDFLINLIQKRFHNVFYISNKTNKGIGYALNVAARQAIKDGYLFLLTMDDDSKAPINMVSEMLLFADNKDDIGIISVNHSIKDYTLPYKQVLYTMTSGNLLNLKAFLSVGPFREDLFIDHVDHEYCLRLNREGFKVVELTTLYLDHNLGEKKNHKFLGSSINYISHNPIRLYYMFRNGIYVSKLFFGYYPIFIITTIMIMAKEIIKVLLFENAKLLRLKRIVEGIYDGINNKLGRKTTPFKHT